MSRRGAHRMCVICGVMERRKPGTSMYFACFPTDENRCKEWLRAVGDAELVQLPVEKLRRLKHICGEHFAKKLFNKKQTRLKRHAIPTEKLSRPPLSYYDLRDYPQHICKSDPVILSVAAESTLEGCEASSAGSRTPEVPEVTSYETQTAVVNAASNNPLIHILSVEAEPTLNGLEVMSTGTQTRNIIPKQTTNATQPTPGDNGDNICARGTRSVLTKRLKSLTILEDKLSRKLILVKAIIGKYRSKLKNLP